MPLLEGFAPQKVPGIQPAKKPGGGGTLEGFTPTKIPGLEMKGSRVPGFEKLGSGSKLDGFERTTLPGMPSLKKKSSDAIKSAMSSGRRRSSDKSKNQRAQLMAFCEDDEEGGDSYHGKFGFFIHKSRLMDRNERKKLNWMRFRSVRYMVRFCLPFLKIAREYARKRQEARLKRRAQGVPGMIEKGHEERSKIMGAYKASMSKARVGCDQWAKAGVSPEATDFSKTGSADTDRSGPRFIFMDGLRLAYEPPQPRRIMSSRGIMNVHTEIRGEVEQRVCEVCPRHAQPLRTICIFDTVTATRLKHVMAEFASAKCARDALVACQRITENASEGRGANISWKRCGPAWAPQLGLEPEAPEGGDEPSSPGRGGQAAVAAAAAPERARSRPGSHRGSLGTRPHPAALELGSGAATLREVAEVAARTPKASKDASGQAPHVLTPRASKAAATQDALSNTGKSQSLFFS